MEDRLLLLALRGRDADVICQVLARAGHVCAVCDSAPALASELTAGAGAAIITEESLGADEGRALARWLADQPPWSDFPVILLATKRSGRRSQAALAVLARLGNVVVLERPVHGETLASAVSSALRVRRRQYVARSQLEELKAAQHRLTELNANLESRIVERTHQLSTANNQLMQEIAERERAQAAFAQSQKMEAVGQLTGGIAHDFNNLLTVVLGNLELIQVRSNDERTIRHAAFARQAAERASTLTHQLLAFSRSEKLTLVPIDINALLSGMNDLLVRTIGQQIKIEIALDETSPWAMADANQLELAILNLAINARDAMPDGGDLTVASSRSARDPAQPDEEPYCVISVSDTGTGIPAHLIEKVFDPFFTTKPVGKGTGLGLSQVYGIARQSGGRVHIDSAEGRGSTVEIWLRSAAAGAARHADEPGLRSAASGPQRRVMIVDDDDGVRRFVVDSLELLGYAVTEASNGVAALSEIETERPDLVVVDFAMPGMNGAQLISQMRARRPDLPVLMATGYADMAAVGEVLDSQCVLRKPFQIGDLDAAIRGVLEPEKVS